MKEEAFRVGLFAPEDRLLILIEETTKHSLGLPLPGILLPAMALITKSTGRGEPWKHSRTWKFGSDT